jgi:hypothetical protein
VASPWLRRKRPSPFTTSRQARTRTESARARARTRGCRREEAAGSLPAGRAKLDQDEGPGLLALRARPRRPFSVKRTRHFIQRRFREPVSLVRPVFLGVITCPRWDKRNAVPRANVTRDMSHIRHDRNAVMTRRFRVLRRYRHDGVTNESGTPGLMESRYISRGPSRRPL